MNNKQLTKKNKIHTYFIIWTFITFISSIGVVFLILLLLNLNFNFLDIIYNHPIVFMIALLIMLFIIGSIMTIIIGNPVLKIIEELSSVLNEVSNGNYKARLKPTKALKELNNNFNKMIAELDSVEILRSEKEMI